MRSVKVLVLLLALTLLPFQALPESRSLTVMIYMAGSDLETRGGVASADLEEMAGAASSAGDTNVVVMTGGSLVWHNGFDPGKNIVSLATDDGLSTQWETPGLSMGEADTLRDFLTRAAEAFPADRYALILWSHGGGPLAGVCFDERYEVDGVMDGLTLEELEQALSQTMFADEPLFFLGFDACMMASAEVACAMAPYAEAMIASQEIVPSGGWDYGFLRDLSRAQSGTEAGKMIVDAFALSMEDEILDAAVSCLDLTRWERTEKEMDAFFAALDVSSPDGFGTVLKAREEAAEVGARSDVSMDLIDLKDWVTLLAEGGAGNAGPLLEALCGLVTVSWTNAERINGLSVYIPCWNKYDFSRVWGSVYFSLDTIPGLTGMISGYAARWLPEKPDPDDPEALMILMYDNYVDVSLPVSRGEETIKKARALILEEAEEGWRQVYTREDVYITDDEVFFNYFGDSLYALNDRGDLLAGPLSYREEGEALILTVRGGDGREMETAWVREDDGEDYILSGDEWREGAAFVNACRSCPSEPLPWEQWPEGTPEESSPLYAAEDGIRLKFLPLFSVPVRAAVFEMTDHEGRLSLSEPTLLEQPARWILTGGPGTTAAGDISLTLKETALYVQAGRCLGLTFGAENTGSVPVTLEIGSISIDDARLPDEAVCRSVLLKEGEETVWDILIPADVISELSVGQCRSLTVRGRLRPDGGEETDAEFSFAFPYHLGILGD